MKLLVTGATGFVGRAVLDMFFSRAYEMTVLVRDNQASLPVGVKKIIADVTNLKQLDNTNFSNIDVIVHTAARVHVMQDDSKDPLSEFRKVNRDATLTLARLAAESGVQRFVFISSIKVNGEMTRLGHPFTPEDQYVPDDPYGLSVRG